MRNKKGILLVTADELLKLKKHVKKNTALHTKDVDDLFRMLEGKLDESVQKENLIEWAKQTTQKIKKTLKERELELEILNGQMELVQIILNESGMKDG